MYIRLISVMLAAAGVVLIAARLSAEPVPAPSPPDAGAPPIQRLIAQLGDKDYFVRQRAEDALAKLGFEAFDALSEATSHDDLEVAARARYLLRIMRVEWTDKNDPPEVKQLLHDYESQDAESRQQRMHSLAALPNRLGLAALCRLVRFERTTILSKQAAVEILHSVKPEADPDPALVAVVRKTLDGNRRTAAVWLLCYARFAADPAAAAEPWSKLVDAELSLLQTAPLQTSTEVVTAMLRFQVARLKKIGRNDEAVTAIRRLLQLEWGDPETLTDLLQWLVDQKAWKAVDELAERFAPQIAANPTLLYALAEAQLAQGHKSRSDELARQAFQLNPGKAREELISHLMVAGNLRQRGLLPWAVREYRQVIAVGGPTDDLTLGAAFILAELLHDQGDDLGAAEVLQDAVKPAAANQSAETVWGDRKLGEVRARMNFFFASHWQSKADAVKHRDYLEKALGEDASDVDVLIACYRLPHPAPAFREKIRQLIRAAGDEVRSKIAEEPEIATNYNQLAWLIANTEGDFDEALRLSRKSLELSPDTGGYYDTLGRVYFARGDLENAVKSQTRAVELDPHSGLIQRQLELFRKKLEEKKQQPAAKG